MVFWENQNLFDLTNWKKEQIDQINWSNFQQTRKSPILICLLYINSQTICLMDALHRKLGAILDGCTSSKGYNNNPELDRELALGVKGRPQFQPLTDFPTNYVSSIFARRGFSHVQTNRKFSVYNYILVYHLYQMKSSKQCYLTSKRREC